MIKQLLSLSLFGLLSLFGYSQNEDFLDSTTIPLELKANANAVIRFEDFQITIESQAEMTINYTRVVTILNEKGNKNVQAIVGYDNYRKVKKIEALVYNEYGEQIKKIKKNDFIDHSAVDGSTLYSDSRVLYMPYTPVSYPYSVKFTYQLETPNTAAIYSWRPIDDYFLSVQESTYNVIDRGNLGLRFKEINLDDFDIHSETSSSSLRYSIKNIEAFKPEELSPSLENYAPKIMVALSRFHYNGVNGQAKNWMEFGDWMQKSLLDGRSEVSQETKQIIQGLVSGVEDPIERARIVYKYVQDNTRYISVQVGIGGIQPIPALEVDKVKYGDCKGLTNYTQALLNVVNVNSYYTVVQAGNDIVDFDSEFASLEQGNHIILGIPNLEDVIWLDCTSQIHPFGFIGDFTDDRLVLAVKPQGSEILRTTRYPDNNNHQITTAEILLDSDASIRAEVEIKSEGIQYDNRFFIERESDKNLEKYYKSYWSYVNNLNINSKKFNNNKDEVVLKESLNLNAREYASVNGDRLIFVLNVFNRNTFIPDRYRNRRFPLVIQRGYLDEDVFTFQLPEGFQIEAIPEKLEIVNKFGEYSIESIIVENKIVYKRRLLIKKGNYLKSEYDAYRNFRKDVAKYDASIVVLKSI